MNQPSPRRTNTLIDTANGDGPRALCLADIHAKTEAFAPHALPPADLILIAGDLTQAGLRRPAELATTRDWLAELVGRYRHVLYVLGNHDRGLSGTDFATTGAIELERTTVDLFGLHFTGTRSCYNRPDPDRPVRDELLNGFDAGGSTSNLALDTAAFADLKGDVFLTHTPPSFVLDADFRRRWGSPGLLASIETQRPKLLVCGHVHESGGYETMVGPTRVINVALGAHLIELPAARRKR